MSQDPEVLSAAILHDTVEDTSVTLEEIEGEFGRRIRDLVAALTDDKNLPKEERKRLQVVHAPGLDPDAKMIKIADKTSNALGRRSLAAHRLVRPETPRIPGLE